jgi:pSer/pThr/pTyr-binding forkhead associated (FHA) protein
MGQATGDVEEAFHTRKLPFGFVPDPANYALRDMRSGRLHLLRVGINTIGRHPDNDIVLPESPVSRRHCVIVVHATGGCEVQDTASLNGVRFGHKPIPRAKLVPGDILRLCDYKFMLLAEPVGGSAEAQSRANETGDLGAARTA